MKNAVVIFLLAFSTTAWAVDERDQRNVYDIFREWLQPSAGATVDEQVTAWIKRHMANLLYRVDMASFARPEKDQKFRDVIMVLQKQMGVPATGILTSNQFDRLAVAAHNVDDAPVLLPLKKLVTVAKDGTWVVASGTGTMDGLANPINKVHIYCFKPDNTCEVRTAGFNPDNHMVDLDDLISYEIKTWTRQRVTAINEAPCLTATMTVDVTAESVTIVYVPAAGSQYCRQKPWTLDKPEIWTLVDGEPIAQRFSRERVNKARALVYAPAQSLLPPERDTSPAQR
jgi:hypothetical protein